VAGNKTMLVMEYVEGGDLWRALQRQGSRVGQWSLQGRRVALDIARGLCFLHAHSIVCVPLPVCLPQGPLSHLPAPGTPVLELVPASAWPIFDDA
jgi:hypothetical protein